LEAVVADHILQERLERVVLVEVETQLRLVQILVQRGLLVKVLLAAAAGLDTTFHTLAAAAAVLGL
jgi:hypothetical protein